MDPSAPDLLPAGHDLGARLAAFAAEARADDAAALRARERWLRQSAGEDATFAGVLVDLAERVTDVVVQGAGGRRHRGTVRAVGADFCALTTAGGREVLLAFAGIAAIRPAAADHPVAGDRAVDLDLGLAEALGVLAAERPRVLVVPLHGGDGVTGELQSAGRDVMVLRAGAPRDTVYVPLGSVAEVAPA